MFGVPKMVHSDVTMHNIREIIAVSVVHFLDNVRLEAQMISSANGAKFLKLGFALSFFLAGLIGPKPAPAQERYPTVARISFVSGPVTYSRGDDPDEWDDAIENVPLTIGDRIYAPEDGRAELQLPSGNFVRLAPRSYFSALNLSDDIKQFYLGDGAASFNVRRLSSDEVIEIDTPNVSVTLDQPGTYRIAVDEDGNSRISVRRGRAIVAASGRQITVENREIRIYGIDSPRYEIVSLPATDAFDRWVTERDTRFERAYPEAYRYASDEIIGVEDLSEYGRWEEIPEYGFAWTPTRVATGWVPFSAGRWFWQDPYGWTWISEERWGWATSHYGRWMPHRSRWYWVPVRPRTRYVRYAPATVEFVRVRDHVGWFPLHPRDRFIPWWERRERQRVQNITYVNRTHVTVVNQNNFISARPIHRHIVRDSVIVREATSTRVISESLPIPSRSSLRVVSETGGRRDHRPPANVLSRAAVVRTAPPAPPPTFQEKLPHIQKSQGKPIEPSAAVALASQDNRAKAHRVRIRPAAEQSRGGDFAPRDPGANTGPAPQPLTEARGKKLATRENTADSNASERTDRAQKTPAPQQPSQPEPSTGTASRQETPRLDQDRDRQRQEKQTPERERQAQQQQQELERKKQEQQKEEERKGQLQNQQQERERQQQLRERQAQQKQQELERKQAPQKEEERKARQQQEQERQKELQDRQGREQHKQQELERRQAQQREEERKAQLQNRQEQERREQLRQQQLQERQAQQQRQQELERRQQRQQEQERGVQAQQQQQEQARREQVRQQQLQDRQAREQQRQQELERRQQGTQVQQRQQEQERVQQLRQQQMQERESQQPQRPPEQRRPTQPRQPQLPGGQPPELQRPPVQP